MTVDEFMVEVDQALAEGRALELASSSNLKAKLMR